MPSVDVYWTPRGFGQTARRDWCGFSRYWYFSAYLLFSFTPTGRLSRERIILADPTYRRSTLRSCSEFRRIAGSVPSQAGGRHGGPIRQRT